MAQPALEVADIIRCHGEDYRRMRGGRLTSEEEYTLRNLAACRTAVLGGHLEECEQCGHERPAYNSCHDRHCPKCQAAARGDWLQQRQSELLPVPYFHLVFTLPEVLRPLALQNKRIVYDALFQAAAETLQEVAATPKHLGGEIGFLAVLHTWGQNLLDHPHLHCVVPGGGLAPDGSGWISADEEFFLPVRVLSRVFRGKLLHRLKRAYQKGELSLHGRLAALKDPQAWDRLVSTCYRTEWSVYAKPPFGGPEQVLKYLARYTHRVAISNHRLISLEDGQVTFRYKDYADGSQQKTMTLAATEFLRRFFLHLLPCGFMRIRYYGFLSNRHRTAKLARCRELLREATADEPQGEARREADEAPVEEDLGDRCPACRKGRLRRVAEFARPSVRQLLQIPWPFDSS